MNTPDTAGSDAPAETCETTYLVERWQVHTNEWLDVSVHFRKSSHARDYVQRMAQRNPNLGPVRVVKIHTHITRTVLDGTRPQPIHTCPTPPGGAS